MRIDDQDKLIKAGFCIIRKDDYPGPRIKMCTGINGGWKTYKKFETKAERDRTFALLLKDDKVIDGVAAFSIACYFFPIIFMVYNAIAQSAQPIISYNFGAGQPDRVRKALHLAIRTA